MLTTIMEKVWEGDDEGSLCVCVHACVRVCAHVCVCV